MSNVMNENVNRIAKDILGIDSLEVRGRDSLDFYDLNVLTIKNALEAAFSAGAKQSTTEEV